MLCTSYSPLTVYMYREGRATHKHTYKYVHTHTHTHQTTPHHACPLVALFSLNCSTSFFFLIFYFLSGVCSYCPNRSNDLIIILLSALTLSRRLSAYHDMSRARQGHPYSPSLVTLTTRLNLLLPTICMGPFITVHAWP